MDGGFVLNIAASSSGAAGRPAKKKNSFRAKQTAKRAKYKASKKTVSTQARTPNAGTNKKEVIGSPASKPVTAVSKPAATGAKPHATTPEKPLRKAAALQQQPPPPAVATPSKRTTTASTALTGAGDDDAHATPTADLSRFDADDSDDDDGNNSTNQLAVAVHSDSDDAFDLDAIVSSAAAADAASDSDNETTATTRPLPPPNSNTTTTTTTAAVSSKTFGTRRNPNKELYDPATLSELRTKVVDTTTTLDRPLESATSEKIFAAKTFASMALDPKLVNVLQKDVASHGFGFERPTTVQVQSIPAILSGRDVLVKSETGSGKTLSYLLPIVQQLQARDPRVKRDDGCLALILAPTRELCMQILETANKLVSPFVYLVPGAIIGGEKKKAEKARLRKGINLLIATPGRLADHLVNTQSFQYAQLQFLVLDEADRLLDMGFAKQITQILSIIDGTTAGANNSDRDRERPSTGVTKRQNVLVSATINSGVQELAKMSLKKPLLVDADGADSANVRTPTTGSGVESFSTPHQLMQHFMIVPAKARLVALTCFLRQELHHSPTSKRSKIVVFLSTCDAVDFHYALFAKTAWPAGRKPARERSTVKTDATDADVPTATSMATSLFGASGAVFRLHGNIPQHERMTAFKNFCTSTSGVLLCTDVAARGLNLPTVSWIVQYDPPTETRDYVHRVGRTARSGNQGSSLLFLMPSESEYLDHLQRHGLTMAALGFEKTLTRVGKYGGFMRSNKKLPHEVVQSDLQFLYDQTVLADKALFALACLAFHSFVRSYATHTSDTRAIFHVRSLHFGHIAKSFALREPPASRHVRDSGKNAKLGTLQKRKDRDDKEKMLTQKRVKKQREQNRERAQHVSEFAD